MADGREVLFEYHRVGAFLKVTAIDAETGREICVSGPATGSRELLTRTAAAKLRWVMEREAGGRGGTSK